MEGDGGCDHNSRGKVGPNGLCGNRLCALYVFFLPFFCYHDPYFSSLSHHHTFNPPPFPNPSRADGQTHTQDGRAQAKPPPFSLPRLLVSRTRSVNPRPCQPQSIQSLYTLARSTGSNHSTHARTHALSCLATCTIILPAPAPLLLLSGPSRYPPARRLCRIMHVCETPKQASPVSRTSRTKPNPPNPHSHPITPPNTHSPTLHNSPVKRSCMRWSERRLSLKESPSLSCGPAACTSCTLPLFAC